METSPRPAGDWKKSPKNRTCFNFSRLPEDPASLQEKSWRLQSPPSLQASLYFHQNLPSHCIFIKCHMKYESRSSHFCSHPAIFTSCRLHFYQMSRHIIIWEPEGHYPLLKDGPLRTRRALSLLKDVLLRTRRALSLLKDVLLRTRRALSLLKDVLLRTRRALSLLKDVLLRTRRALSLLKDVLLRTRRALSLLKDVPLRTRRAISLLSDSALENQKGTLAIDTVQR